MTTQYNNFKEYLYENNYILECTLENFLQPAKYFPDIKLPNKLIEVKSTFTYELEKENNERKFRACVESGNVLEVWIYNRKKELVMVKCYQKDQPILVFME